MRLTPAMNIILAKMNMILALINLIFHSSIIIELFTNSMIYLDIGLIFAKIHAFLDAYASQVLALSVTQ